MLPNSVWSSDVVIRRLREAARVLQALPGVPGPSSKVAMQVDVVRSFWEAYGAEPARYARVIPSGAEIDRADEALAWLPLLAEVGDRLLVLARSHGVKWKHLERRFGMTERGLRKRHRRAILTIVLRLNAIC